MHEAGTSSWRMSVDQSWPLTIGLFVRDAAALHSDLAWLPPASPAVRGDGSAPPEEPGKQWDDWWTRAVAREPARDSQVWPASVAFWWAPPSFEALVDTPALQAVVADRYAEASAWAVARKREHANAVLGPAHSLVETTLVADLEHAAGHLARPFSLHVTEIPVAGQRLWQIQADHVLVSAALIRDTSEYRRRMTPVIEALL